MSEDADGFVRSMFKGSSVVFVGQMLEMAISFLGVLVIARILGPFDFGQVSIGVTSLLLSTTIVIFGLDQGIARYLPRFDDDGRERGILVSAFQISLPLALVATALLYVLAPTAAGFVNKPSLAPVLRIFAVALPFSVVVRLTVGTVQGYRRSVPKVVLQNITIPSVRITLAFLALFLGFRAIGVAWAYALSFVAAGLVSVWYLSRDTNLFESVSTKTMRHELLVFSAPLVVTAVMSRVLIDFDILLLTYFSQTGDVGVYRVAYQLAMVLFVVIHSVGYLVKPIASELHAEGRENDLRRIYQVATKWMFLGNLPLFVLLGAFPALSLSVAFGTEYAAGAPALSILAVAFLFHTALGPNNQVLLAIGLTRVQMYDTVLATALNIGLNLVLIPQYGIVGAAIATTVSYVVLNLLVSAQLYLSAGVQPFTPSLVRPGILSLAVVVLLWFVTHRVTGLTMVTAVGAIVAFGVAHAVIVLKFGGVDNEEVMLLESFEKRFGVDADPLRQVLKRLM